MEKKQIKSSELIDQLSVIIFDLDDTLIDTYSILISPLEKKAARMMINAGCPLRDEKELASLLLEFRRTSPSIIEQRISEVIINIAPEILDARQSIFSRDSLRNLNLQDLKMDPEVLNLIQGLKKHYMLYLVSEGILEFQKRKVEQLDLWNEFDNVFIVRNSSEKESKIRLLIRELNLPAKEFLVVGNRLDREIRAGNRLGATTAWVRRGEGEEIDIREDTEKPDYILSSVLDLREILPEK